MSVSARHKHIIAGAFAAMLTAACGGDKTVAPVVLPDALRGVAVSPLTGSAIAGQTLTLSATPDPVSATVVVTTTFASGAPAVATVSATGVVNGGSAGTSVITVSSTGSGTGFTTITKTATATITVTPAPDALRGLTASPTTGNAASHVLTALRSLTSRRSTVRIVAAAARTSAPARIEPTMAKGYGRALPRDRGTNSADADRCRSCPAGWRWGAQLGCSEMCGNRGSELVRRVAQGERSTQRERAFGGRTARAA